ncbi:hypothetical protein MRX96_039830 [Rhipicephalus microplus]
MAFIQTTWLLLLTWIATATPPLEAASERMLLQRKGNLCAYRVIQNVTCRERNGTEVVPGEDQTRMPDWRLQRLHCSYQTTCVRDTSSDAAEGGLGVLSRVLRSCLHSSDTASGPASDGWRRRRTEAKPSRPWNCKDMASTARPTTTFNDTLQLRKGH